MLVGAYITVGRFIVKRWLASRSTYVLTDRRAIVVLPRSTVELRVPGPTVTVRRSRNLRHATVGFGSSTSAQGAQWLSGAARAHEVEFRDVVGPDELLRALDRIPAR